MSNEKLPRQGAGSGTSRCQVYMALASDGSLYTGISADPERRVMEHNRTNRGARALRGKRPVRLLRRWVCEDRSAALRLEAEIKRLRACAKWSIVLGNDSDPPLATKGPRQGAVL